MNSINEQQPEDNFKDLNGAEALAKLKDLAEGAKTCFFCSNIKAGISISARPMTVQEVDDEGNLWFMIANDSNTYREIEKDAFVQLFFQGSTYSDYLDIYGIGSLVNDKEKIKEYWKPTLKTWFTEGEGDPRIALVMVTPTKAYYWDNKHGNAVAFVKQLAGAAVGKTFDDSVEGALEV